MVAAAATLNTQRAEIAAAARAGFGFYVYELADAAGTFYVGKGCGQRAFAHLRLPGEDRNHRKLLRIAQAGQSLAVRIVAYFRCEAAAFAEEAARIKAGAAWLTNIASGQAGEAVEQRKAHAARMLSAVKPFERWAAGLPPALMTVARLVYDRITGELARQAVSPAPVEIAFGRDGKVIYAW
jgi:hypothetical protein